MRCETPWKLGWLKIEEEKKKENDYEDTVWDAFGMRHPGGTKSTARLAKLARFYAGKRTDCTSFGEGYSCKVKKMEILNICCGDGSGTECFLHEGVSICGIDQSEYLLKKAEEKYPQIEWIHADARRIPFPDGQFSAVLSECSLSLMKQNRKELLREIVRVLKQEGLLLVSDIIEEGGEAKTNWNRELEGAGLKLLCWEEHPEWIMDFVARWLWEFGKLPPAYCFGKTEKKGRMPGYFLAVYIFIRKN